MSSRAVLVIHAPDQDSQEPLREHQEKHECGCGWWDYTHLKDEPQQVPIETVTEAHHYGVFCLPDGQLFFQPEKDDSPAWTDEKWEQLVCLILSCYPGHLVSIIWCHS